MSAPFHCELLTPAADGLADVLADIKVSPLRVPYISNIDAKWHTNATPEDIKQNLIGQVVTPVRWSESISLMIDKGIDEGTWDQDARTLPMSKNKIEKQT